MGASERTILGAKCLFWLPATSPMGPNKALLWLSTYLHPQVVSLNDLVTLRTDLWWASFSREEANLFWPL